MVACANCFPKEPTADPLESDKTGRGLTVQGESFNITSPKSHVESLDSSHREASDGMVIQR